MAKFQIQITTEHAVLFLMDATPGVAIPPDAGAASVTATDNCLAFWVLSYVDGASVVTITDKPCETSGIELFSGSINAPSGVITLSDSSAFEYLNVPVPKGRSKIKLWADDTQNPEWVWI